MGINHNLKSQSWITDPSEDELRTVRSIVGIPAVVSAWIHTGDEMQLEPCNFRLVLEIDSNHGNSLSINTEIRQRAARHGFSVSVWCIPVGKTNQFPWLTDKAVRLI